MIFYYGTSAFAQKDSTTQYLLCWIIIIMYSFRHYDGQAKLIVYCTFVLAPYEEGGVTKAVDQREMRRSYDPRHQDTRQALTLGKTEIDQVPTLLLRGRAAAQ